MKDYSIVKEYDGHFEISHPKEGLFKVAKNKLDDATVKRIRKLPQAMADGGEVQENMPLEDVPPPTDAASLLNTSFKATGPNDAELAQRSIDPGSSGNNATPQELSGLKSTLAAQAPAQVTPASYVPGAIRQVSLRGGGGESGQGNAAGLGMNMPIYENAFGKIQSGIEGQAAAEAAAGQQMAKVQQDFAAKQQAANDHWTQQVADWQKDDQRLRADYASTKIDPTRVWSNASTGNKVLAGIGILLSGIGSGLTGQPNLAIQSINQTIERDIDSQKADLNKKANLVSENYRRFGDMHMAEQMTRANLLASTQAQIAASAAKMGSAQATARAQQAIGQLDLQKADIYRSMAVYGMQNDMMRGGTGSGNGMPLSQGNGIDPVMANRLFPGQVVNVPDRMGGGVTIAKTKEAATGLTKSLSSLDSLDKMLDRADKFQKENGTTWLPSKNAEAEAIHNGIAMSIGQLHDLGRMSDTDLQLWQEMAPNPGAFFQGKASAKTSALRSFVKDKVNSELAGGTVSYNPGKFDQTSPMMQPPVLPAKFKPGR